MLTLGTQHIAKPTNIPHKARYNIASISLTMLTLGTQRIAKPSNIPHNARYNID